MTADIQQLEVQVPVGAVLLEGSLTIPKRAKAIVLFAHGSGSSRFSSRNRFVATVLNDAGLATLLFDLLTPEEHEIDQRTRHLRFDIGLLTERLSSTVDWVSEQPAIQDLRIGLFGASTGAAAALATAAERPKAVAAVVSRGGRPDLAGAALPQVQAPTLLIVGGNDVVVIDLNQQASRALRAEQRLEIIPGASHLFEEPGKLEQAARLACNWFKKYLLVEA